jgi:asparagine synthase (glutamine-hydrolysing)
MVQTAVEIYNRGCAQFGVEARFPFLDKRVVEFCVAIPGEQKVSGGFTRAVVRRALQGYLPDAIRLRTDKGDLGWSFRGGFDSRRELVNSTLESAGAFLGRYLDATRMNGLRDRFRKQTLVEDELMNLFLAVVLSAWHARTAPGLVS